MTAKELLAELNADPAFVARRAAEDRRLEALVKECEIDERELVQGAKALGYDIKSVYDFVNNTPHPFLPREFVGSYQRAYPLLVAHLAKPHHPVVREGVVRALIVRDGGELVKAALLEQFEREADPKLRWVLAHALIYAMPYRERRKYPEIAKVRYRKSP